jgi:signal transduction histidine kinase
MRLSIRTWITAVSLLALLPMLCFSSLMIYRQIAERQDRAQAGLQRRATVTAVAIGNELASVFTALNVMSQTDGASAGDLAATRALAQRIVASDDRLAAMSVDVDNAPGAAGRRGISTRLAGDAGELGEGHAVVVTAPLGNGNGTGPAGPLVVRAAVRADTFLRRLNEQAWPADWTAAVVDENHIILARSREAERYVGQQATQTLIDGLRSGKPRFHASTKDGIDSVVSVAKVPGVAWTVAVARPVSALNAQVRESMLSIFTAGLLCVALGTGGALFLARYLGRQLRQVADGHVAGREDPGTGPGSGLAIHEVAELAQALTTARRAEALAAQALQSAREDALAQLKERSEMLDVLAHEVRQPLNNASAALQAASGVLTTSTQPQVAARLTRAGDVLREVQASIDNTLAVAALLVSGDSVRRQDTDIDALIGVAIADMPEREVRRVRVDRATPTRTAAMDAGLMRLALRNLLSNALKYSPHEAEVVVRVADSDEPLALVIDVIDAGPGIEAELLGQLFDRGGRRAAGPQTRRQGLGLYIVRRVMELHGGSVSLVRNTPQGTTMRLVIDQGSDD